MAQGVETRIILSADIKKFLSNLLKHGSISRTLKTKIRIALTSNSETEHSIPYEVLTDAHDFYTEFTLTTGNSDYVEIRNLVKTSKVFNETIPEPVRSPELVKRLTKLKAEQEQREYNQMVKNVKTNKMTLGQEVGQAVRTTGQQAMSVVNFVLSVVATFAFAFVASQYAFSEDLGLRLIFSIVLATAVALAELFFMARIEI